MRPEGAFDHDRAVAMSVKGCGAVCNKNLQGSLKVWVSSVPVFDAGDLDKDSVSLCLTLRNLILTFLRIKKEIISRRQGGHFEIF